MSARRVALAVAVAAGVALTMLACHTRITSVVCYSARVDTTVVPHDTTYFPYDTVAYLEECFA